MHRLFLTSATAFALAACQWSGKSEDRDVGTSTSRTYQVAAFNKVEVMGPYDVEVVTGKDVSVAASGGGNLLDETEVIVENGTLRIAPKKRKGIRLHWSGGKATFTVSTAMMNGVSIAGSGDVKVDKVAGEFEGDVAGSGSIDVGEIKGGKVEFGIAGAGDLRAAGTADSVEVNIAGSGNVEAAGLTVRAAEVSIAGSGDVKLTATETANVSIAGSGDVDIAGGAKCSTSKMGGGNVTCR
jgi:hypothetical protein